MFKTLPDTYKGILLALAGYSGFAVADACAKYLTQTYTVYQTVAMDNAMAALMLLALAPWLGGFKSLFCGENYKIHTLRAVLNFAVNLLVVGSLMRLPMVDVYTLLFTKPFFAALMGMALLGQGLTRPRFLAMSGGFLGVLVALRPGIAGFDPFVLVPLLGASVIAAMFITARFLKSPSIVALGFFPLMGSALMTAPLAASGFIMPGLLDWGIITIQSAALALGVVGVSLAFRMAHAAAVSPFVYIQMIWGLVLGAMVFGDLPDLWMLGGAGLIILSGLYLLRAEHTRNTP